ncbi:uncharacterized protein LOC141651481 [Silene latifolia]|uniref:uncharacterized protein LOC141651481 n=1 Tax=Silene latifolia TaxID=37657 RepID=UPI003D783E14
MCLIGRPDDITHHEVELFAIIFGFISVILCSWHQINYRDKQIAWCEYERVEKRKYWLDSIMNGRICREQLRMDRHCFDKLCHILQIKGGLKTTRNVTIKEVVAYFLHILGHDLKNRTIGAVYTRSGETVSRHFHMVLRVVMKVGQYYIKERDSTVSFAIDSKWKWFEGVVGALDGTHLEMTVYKQDRPRYRNKKGDITTNVLATCDNNLRFSYVLPGWEGLASDPRVLYDALRRPNGLKLIPNKYYLVDLRYTNGPGFLAPYKRTRYHLNLWRGNTPTNYKELFNLRHSSARNTIERAFGILKKRWAILRKSSFFDKKTQVRIINACFILHNFVRGENMNEDDLLAEVDEELANSIGDDTEVEDDVGLVSTVRSTEEWNAFRDNLALKFNRTAFNHDTPPVRIEFLICKLNLVITGLAMSMSNKEKAPMSSSTQSKKRGYVTWTKQMDETMIGVLHNQLKEGNKADGEWKPQAYHAVADELWATMDAVVSTDNVKNRLKSWKKHYANISDIRTLTKFRWDEDRKMIVIGSEDSEQWSTFIKENPPAAPYKNKSIEYWDDICTLCGPDRALGDGVEMHNEAAEAMDDDVESEGGSSNKFMSSSKSKKQKRDKLADVVTSFTECFQEYVQSKPKENPKPTPQEIHDVVKNVKGIGRHQVMKATRKFTTGPLSDFEMLKSLPNDDKLDWVLECLGAGDTGSSIY